MQRSGCQRKEAGAWGEDGRSEVEATGWWNLVGQWVRWKAIADIRCALHFRSLNLGSVWWINYSGVRMGAARAGRSQWRNPGERSWGLGPDGGNGGGEKWTDARCILKEEPAGYLTVFSCRVWQAVKSRSREDLVKCHTAGQRVAWRMGPGCLEGPQV